MCIFEISTAICHNSFLLRVALVFVRIYDLVHNDRKD